MKENMTKTIFYKMKNVIRLALVAMVGMMMTSCMSVNLGNWGDFDETPSQVSEISKVTAMQPFDKVDMANAFRVIYDQGDTHSVRVEASEQAFKEMTVYVKDGDLRIRKAVKKSTADFSKVKVYVTSPDIKGIEIAGSGVFAASNRVNVSGDLDMEIAGSGNIMLADVTCKDADMEIAGSGNIEIGSLAAKDAKAEIAGSGDVKLGTLACTKLDIEIAGSGDVICDNITADDVHTEIAGSGDVTLKGTVKHHTEEIAGSGKVNITGLATQGDSIK